MTKIERNYFYERAFAVQNHPANAMIDIVSYIGYCDSFEQAERHVSYYEAKAGLDSALSA